jgi:anti-sigma factor RsiW
MNQPISPRDARLLSEYIDGQLKPGPRARLEARLEADAGLRQALDDLARTCQLLRSQEPLRVPRSFILTQAMVGGKKPAAAPTYPVFGLVSAMATVLLILVLAGDWLSGRGLFPGMPGVSQPNQALMAAPVAEMAVSEEIQVEEEMASEPQTTATPRLAQESVPAEAPAPSAKSAPGTAADESARELSPADAAGETGPDAALMGAAEAETVEAAGMGAPETTEVYPYPDSYPYPEMSQGFTLFGIPRLLLTVIELLLAAAAVAFLVLFLAKRARLFHRDSPID